MLTALPVAIRAQLDQIETIVKQWPLHVRMDHVLKWVLQFEPEDYGLAARVVCNLQVLGSSDVRQALEVAHVKLQRRMAAKDSNLTRDNTLYVAIGSASKSGALVSYYYRVAADLSEDDFLEFDEGSDLDLSKVENIVFVDDVIGTGQTVASELGDVLTDVHPLKGNRNIYVLTVAGYEEGIRHVEKETGADVVSALRYGATDTVTSPDARFFDGMPASERMSALESLKRYCRALSRHELGFGSVGGLLVFDHNTPNTTLPIVWSRSRNWTPLFSRATRIHGAAKVKNSAAAARKALPHEPSSTVEQPHAKPAGVTLFVEGKLDELFVDYLRLQRGLAEKVGVDDISAISLGGLYQSPRLLELLRETRKHAVFVLDSDEYTQRAFSHSAIDSNPPVLYLRPSFTALLDVDKVYGAANRLPALPPREMVADGDVAFFHELERALLKRGSVSANAERITHLIGEFLDSSRYEEFAQELKVKVAEVIAATKP